MKVSREMIWMKWIYKQIEFTWEEESYVFLLEKLLNIHEKNNYVFVLVLIELIAKILKRKDWGMHKTKATKVMNEAQWGH